MQGAPGQTNVSVCARASYIRLTEGNTYTCGKNDSIVSTPGSAEEAPCCPLSISSSATEPLVYKAAAPDMCHGYAYALLQLHVIVCLWRWAMCAWELDRQPPRSATTKEGELSCRVWLQSRVEHDTVQVAKL